MIDSGSKIPENRIHLFDPVGLINDKYANYGAGPRPATSSYESLAGQTTGVGGGGLRLTVKPKVADSGSGGSSPRLWNSNSNNSPPTSPKFTNPEPMSPNSRTQAIAHGRRELMEMIKDIPESCYELSLRDIVERKPSPPPPPATVVQPSQEVSKKVEAVEKKLPPQEVNVLEARNEKKGNEKQNKKKKKKVGKSESKKKMVKSKSVDNGGFLLRTTVFPIPFRSKKKKRSLSLAPSFKVAPKSSVKGSEKNWWGRKSRVSSEIESGVLTSESLSSSRSSSIVSRHIQTNRFLPSCCSFFNDKKMKAKK